MIYPSLSLNALVKAVQGKLIVTIVDVNGKETTLKEDENLFSKEAYDTIYNHLLNRELDASEKPIPVSIQINKDYKGVLYASTEWNISDKVKDPCIATEVFEILIKPSHLPKMWGCWYHLVDLMQNDRL